MHKYRLIKESSSSSGSTNSSIVYDKLFILCRYVVVLGFPETTAQEKEVEPSEILATVTATKVAVFQREQSLSAGISSCQQEPRLCGEHWPDRDSTVSEITARHW